MAKTTRETSNTDDSPRVLETGGELLPGEAMIDVVLRGRDPELLYWDGTKWALLPEFQSGETLYRPSKLHPSAHKAFLLPGEPAGYDNLRIVFEELIGLYEYYFDLDALQAQLSAAWDFTTWVADMLPSPPRLSIFCPNLDFAMHYMRFKRCLCRRAVLFADVPAFHKLPMIYRPTLLLSYSFLSPRKLALLCDSNHNGAFVAGAHGDFIDPVSSKALYVGNGSLSSLYWIRGSIAIYLPSASSHVHELSGQKQEEISKRYQALFLTYRLRNAHRIRDGVAGGPEDRGVCRNLEACFPDDPDLIRPSIPLLESSPEDSHGERCDELVRAILQVLWGKLHEGVPEITVGRLVELINTLLSSLDRRSDYKSEDVGWKLRKLAIPRTKRRIGKVVQFSEHFGRHLHFLIRTMGIDVRIHPETCSDCKDLEGAAE